jgi:hypothetical protein
MLRQMAAFGMVESAAQDLRRHRCRSAQCDPYSDVARQYSMMGIRVASRNDYDAVIMPANFSAFRPARAHNAKKGADLCATRCFGPSRGYSSAGPGRGQLGAGQSAPSKNRIIAGAAVAP